MKLKFRTAKRTFEREKLVADLGLKPLNDMDDVEAYGRGPRVKCKNLRGPWQEVQIDAHSWDEIDTPEFWSFVERAVAGFHKFTERVAAEAGRRDAVEGAGPEVAPLEEGLSARQADGLEAGGARRVAGDARTTRCRRGSSCGTTRSVVYLMVPGVREPWATVCTKRLAGVDLILNGPKGAFQLGGVAELGADRALATKGDDRDQVKLRFVPTDELHDGKLAAFLKVHLEAFRERRRSS